MSSNGTTSRRPSKSAFGSPVEGIAASKLVVIRQPAVELSLGLTVCE